MSLTNALRWRYATKKFDPKRSVPEAIVDSLLESANLSATSYGLQPYRFIVVRDRDLQQQLVTSSYGQRQVADASHLIVIATRTDVDESYICDYIDMMEQQRNLDRGRLKQYGNVMVGAISSMSDDHRKVWAARQAYIALGTLLAACGTLEIDSCPMEGFVPSEYNELLQLNEQNLHAAVVLPIGYRAADDATQHHPKVRQPLEKMVIRIGG
jgi:nitroreductase